MKKIKCKYCGKIYSSPSEMRKRKCHSHPKGAWGGYCTPDSVDGFFWALEKNCEDLRHDAEILKEDLRQEEQEKEVRVREYKKHTPLLDCVLDVSADGEPSGYSLQIRNLDLNQFALDMANGIEEKSRDAINTVYALRAGCDYVLNNEDAQKERSLGIWLDEIKLLRDEVVSWDFWVALYWLTKPINDANAFHLTQVIPMLRVLREEADDGDRAIMNRITSHVRTLKSKEKGFKRNLEELSQRIKDRAFWSVLYCLYWMELRPTPWDDQKVWPIQDVKESAQSFDPENFCASQHLRTFREKSLGMSKVGDLWAVNLSDEKSICLTSDDGDLNEGLRSCLWHGKITEDGVSGDFLTELKFNITMEDHRPILLTTGEFRGDYPHEFVERLREDCFLIDNSNIGEDASRIWWSYTDRLDDYDDLTFPELFYARSWYGDYRYFIAELGESLVELLPFMQKNESGSLKELEDLIGLERVKDEVRKLVELVKFNAARKAKGLSSGGMTSHYVFTGNPGTGKTTVARIIAGIYRQLGILKKGHLVEVDRSKLVAGYVGHTAIQTNAVVDSAMDGVLFIDEAYSLVAGGQSDFGSEAIATLLKRMEDARERIIVIVAGYADEMHRFVRSNPGLESRFTKFIEFPDYSIDELVSIFDSIVKTNQFTCSSTAHELVRKTIESATVDGHISGNARYVRNLFDAVRERMARRVMMIENASMIQLQTIEAEDIGEVVGGTSQQLTKPSAVANVKNDTAQAAAIVSFSKSQYLKDLRERTLGLKEVWTDDGKRGWELASADGMYLSSWLRRVQINLGCELWWGKQSFKDGTDDFLTEPSFSISHDGKMFDLRVNGVFGGNWPAEKYKGIDFETAEIQNDLAAAEAAYCSAWGSFGIDVKIGENIGHNPKDIWWNVTIPFKDHDELVSDEFSQKLRGSLAQVAAAFATLLPYRVSINNDK